MKKKSIELTIVEYFPTIKGKSFLKETGTNFEDRLSICLQEFADRQNSTLNEIIQVSDEKIKALKAENEKLKALLADIKDCIEANHSDKSTVIPDFPLSKEYYDFDVLYPKIIEAIK
jgi:hypothetical protein